jgi:hypothetical protein
MHNVANDQVAKFIGAEFILNLRTFRPGLAALRGAL